MDEHFRDWHLKQGQILTGQGKLLQRSSLFTDYLPSDLPHFHLSNGSSHTTFRRWKNVGRTSSAIVGCWSRPLFTGGFLESTEADTEAFNLQTPSIFIDMRFPKDRPANLAHRSSLENCSPQDLQVLGRQHCFAGYSLPEPYLARGIGEVITRHHVIDWNFHPRFPRPRPNRWWIEVDSKGQSFKEYSVIRDEFNIPIYFERWERRAPLSQQQSHYLALRRKDSSRDGIIVVVGKHFAIALDRPPISTAPCPPTGPGASYLDHLVQTGDIAAAQDFLRLEGHFGVLDECSGLTVWTIKKSTLPWLEGTAFFDNTSFEFEWNQSNNCITEIRSHVGDRWEVLECSFSPQELSQIFPCRSRCKL